MSSFGIVLQLLLTGTMWQHVFSTCVNLAYGKNATQSSDLTYNNYVWRAGLAVDGKTAYSEQPPSCSGTNDSALTWWQVDLGALVAVNKIRVFGRQASPPYQLQGFEAYVSTKSGDRTPSTLVYTNAVTSGQYNDMQGQFTIDMNTTLARYISIERNINTTHMYGVPAHHKKLPLVICEVHVNFCDEIPLTDKMINGSAENSVWGTSWANTVDGNKTQTAETCRCCALSNFLLNPFLRIDLGKKFRLSHIKVYGRSDKGGYFPLDTLQTLHIYVHISPTDLDGPVFIENSSSVSTVSKNLAPFKLGQYVTLQLDGNRYLVICEIVIKPACPDKYYGPNCSRMCGNCKHGDVCDSNTGRCPTCEAGYQSPFCVTACPDHFYGDCSLPCGRCKGGMACDKATGHCEHGCESGFKNTSLCDQQCDNFTYGDNCIHLCGNCWGNSTCNKGDGHCDRCALGYKGALCKDTCPDHFYGDCSLPCGRCKGGVACNKATGHCEQGCESGFKNTSLCVQPCDDFTYGDNCIHLCGNCWDNSTCNKGDGHCDRCALGYKGTLCKDACPDQFYGDCSLPCGRCKGGVACDKATGHCEHGCESGFKNTSLCVQPCDDITYGDNCIHLCGNCWGNSFCNKGDGHCDRCAFGYQGTLCKDACPDHFYGDCSSPCGHCKGGMACDKATGHCELGCESGFKNTSLCDQQELADTDTSSQTTIGVTVGVTASLVVVAVVTAGLVLYRRRGQIGKKTQVPSCSGNAFNNVEHVPEQSIVYAKPTRKSRDSVGTQSVEPATKGAIKEKKEKNRAAAKSSSKDGHEYYNFAPLANGLRVCHFWSYIIEKKADEGKLFYEEFKNLKRGLVEKHEHALNPANRGKNRYREMYAYDDTRVVLEIDEEGATDYINACYINGYVRNAKFIASQGPIKDMDIDFWRMVWQQNSTMIVMLTNLNEMGGEKCKKYWPDPDETVMIFGRIKIKTDSQENFGDFIIRRLAVSRDTETPRAVTQYHFRAWPDKDVPDTTWCLVNFWRRVMMDATGSSHEKAPIVVHCSAGIGRTGTFIALDNLYNQARTEGYLRPFQVVEALRKQRVNMVQTREQYVYLHEAVADALLIGTHHIMAEQFKDVYTFLAGSDPGSKKSRLELQYELMEESLSYQRSKLEGEGDYVYSNILGNTDSGQDADELKITFWADHNDVNSFVVTKKPTRATQDNFWSLVEQNQIRTFVIASSLDEASDRMSSWLGTGSDAGSFNVNYISKRKMDGFMEKNFSYCRKNKEESYLTTVRQFELTTWGHERAPTDPASVIRLYEGVRSWQPHLKKEEPILIYCRTGSERSGLLFTVLSLLFKFEAENENTKLNIMGKVMDVKQRDMAYIPNYVQYKFVHDVIMEHLSQKEVSEEQVYVNYQESI